ncbi:hypothetical protein [Bradyrhizobium sp. CCBAU 51765]|uniref:hypothetical protein n=1 Tax=Bradyrhizobium sp. CCBAU 51765 TaxID=1325102 RepID=UPI00188887C1|nr:hypothetical protein [Bradyrhizobium sp. CCBAU 51765]
MSSVKVPTSQYESLLAVLWSALGPDRKPLLIGIDGREGAGKTSLSNWLAWQLGMPVIHLDLFLKSSEAPGPIARRIAELDRCIKARGDRPLIVEGAFLLDALNEVGRSPDFLIFVEVDCAPSAPGSADSDVVDPREFSLANQVLAYLARCTPLNRANFKLKVH